jgi:hypothetical protein
MAEGSAAALRQVLMLYSWRGHRPGSEKLSHKVSDKAAGDEGKSSRCQRHLAGGRRAAGFAAIRQDGLGFPALCLVAQRFEIKSQGARFPGVCGRSGKVSGTLALSFRSRPGGGATVLSAVRIDRRPRFAPKSPQETQRDSLANLGTFRLVGCPPFQRRPGGRSRAA